MKTGKVVLGTLAGLAIGAIAGIIFAPKKGSETRKQIKDKGNDVVNEVKSKYDKISDSITEKFERTTKDVEEFVDKGKAKFYNAKKDVKEATANINQNGAPTEHSTF